MIQLGYTEKGADTWNQPIIKKEGKKEENKKKKKKQKRRHMHNSR
jgi:hypothetical protein